MSDERRGLLIGRAVEREADERDWDELLALADRDETLLRELAESQRDQVRLECLMDRVETMARRVRVVSDGVPEDGSDSVHGHRPRPVLRRTRTVPIDREHPPIRRLGAWSGWAVAALVAVAWFVGRSGLAPSGLAPSGLAPSGLSPSGTPAVQTAGWGSAQEAFDAYLDQGQREGRVLSDAPRRVLIESRPAIDGPGIELIYVQQIIERTIVPDLIQYRSADERGVPAPVRVTPLRRGAM